MKMHLTETGQQGMNWINVTQDGDTQWAGVNTVMKLKVPKDAVNFLSNRGNISFPRRILTHGIGWLVSQFPKSYC